MNIWGRSLPIKVLLIDLLINLLYLVQDFQLFSGSSLVVFLINSRVTIKLKNISAELSFNSQDVPVLFRVFNPLTPDCLCFYFLTDFLSVSVRSHSKISLVFISWSKLKSNNETVESKRLFLNLAQMVRLGTFKYLRFETKTKILIDRILLEGTTTTNN